MGATAAILISLGVVSCAIGVFVFCTWSWWKRTWNRYWRGEPPVPEATWEYGGNQHTFEQLDASSLGRGIRQHRDSVVIERLPTLSDLDIDPRQSFELRRTRAPAIVNSSDEANVYSNDWFHSPYQSFPRSDLEYQKVIGKGWFGRVIEAEAKNIVHVPKIKRVVVKQMRDDASDEEQLKFLNECRVYRDSNSTNVLKLLGFSVDSLPYIVILEYWPLGDLKSYLIAKQKCGESSNMLNQGMIIRMAIDIVKGLEWMFDAGYVHEDLAVRNCLVASAAGKIVIGDYGLSTQKYAKDYYTASNTAIPIRWTAPETLSFLDGSFKHLKMTRSANIWSFGIVLWELFQFGKLPYETLTDDDVIHRVITSKTYVLEPPEFPYLQDSAKDKLYKLMLSCWNSIPENRPSIQQIGEILSTP